MRINLTGGFCALLLILLPHFSFCQLNMTLQDSVTYTSGVNDVCGWASPTGSEYAIVGLHSGVAIVDIDSDTLKEVAFVPTVNNLWKDINTYGHYAYVCSEANVGILIIDLQYLPDSVQTYIWFDSIPTSDGPKQLKKGHTLWTDENGILYINGSNVNNGGVIMFDVTTNPTSPTYLGSAPNIYSHDCYTRDSIIYSSEIYAGNVSIYDAHDPQDIKLLGRVKTPHEFTHNSWLSDNGRFMFTTDERNNAFVTSYDISDFGNIIELDRYTEASKVGQGNVPHNVYVWNDWVVVAYYANGTTIVDGSRPDNMIQVGNFDSFLGQEGGFPGVWGSYPYLPSGKILSSDRNSGLYVFIPNYVRACYLEGQVIDSVTRLPINGASIVIETDEILLPESSKIDGTFKTGKAIPGVYNITIKKYGYYDKTIAGDFINGEVLSPTVELLPLPTYAVSGNVLYAEGGDVPFAKVTLMGPDEIYQITCDENGNFLIPAVFKGSYDLQAGVWGHTYEAVIEMDAPQTLILQLVPGYRDDFDVDQGWTVTQELSSGVWGRGVPVEAYLFETYLCSSDGDSPNDNGVFAYTTGLSNSNNVQANEVSGGITWLASPPMDLTEVIEPRISFDYWLCEFPPNQYIGVGVWVTNGVDTILVENLVNPDINGTWATREYSDLSFIPEPLDQVQFLVSAMDTTSGPGEYILKVHIDNFKLLQRSLSNRDPYPVGKYFVVYPNPVTGSTLYLKSIGDIQMNITTVNLFDLQGRALSTNEVHPGQEVISINHRLDDGMYFIQWLTADGQIGVEKVTVLK